MTDIIDVPEGERVKKNIWKTNGRKISRLDKNCKPSYSKAHLVPVTRDLSRYIIRLVKTTDKEKSEKKI